MSLELPENVYAIFGVVYQISNYNVLPTASLYQAMFPNSTATSVINKNFERFGYDSSFLDNSNNTPIFILILLLTIMFSLAIELYFTSFEM